MTTKESPLITNTNVTLVRMVLDRWNTSLKSCDELINSLGEEQLANEISPGRNTGKYIIGHLIAVHDNMLPLLELGNKDYPVYTTCFIEAPDKTVSESPSLNEVRYAWNKQKEELRQKFGTITTDGWFEKHSAVTAEDFVKEPHRNKLNIILTRTTHLNYHTGQLILLK